MRYDDRDTARRVTGPAISLIITSAICLLLVLLGIVFDVWLLASGEVAELERNRQIDPATTVQIRIAWSVLILIANVVILAGAIAMMRLRNRGLAMTACVLAVIPCVGPCFLLGLPFGIWGLVAMNDPDVRRAFGGDRWR